MGTVTATAHAPKVKSSIDRRTYSVRQLEQRTVGGSISDVLRNIPSVSVDVQGNVSLRADADVTILIDGRP